MSNGREAGDDAFAEWFGKFATEPKRERAEPEGDPEWTPETLRQALSTRGIRFERSAPGRFAHYRHADGAVSIFVGGDSFRLPASDAAFAPLVTGVDRLDAESLERFRGNDPVMQCIATWIHHDYLFVVDPDSE